MKRNQQKGEGMIYFEYFFSIDVLCFITKLVRAKKKKKNHNIIMKLNIDIFVSVGLISQADTNNKR